MLGKIAFCLIVCAVSAPVYSFVLTRGSLDDTYEPIPACPTNDNENVTFYPAINCSKFWECGNGRPFLEDCPGVLEFNPVAQVCTEPDDSNCTGQGWSTSAIPTIPTTTTTSTTTTSAPTTSPTVDPTWFTTWFANAPIRVK